MGTAPAEKPNKKGKAVPQHTYGSAGGGGEDVYHLLIHDLGTRWLCVVSVTPWPHFTPLKRTHWTGG
jgi:hypothetical protein